MTVRGNTPSSETDTTKLVEGLLEADDSAAAARALRDKRARDETPWPAEALWALGVIERKAGHHGRAREAFEAAVEDAPDHPLYRWGAALQCIELSRLSNAKSHLEALVESGSFLEGEARSALEQLPGPPCP